MVYGVWEESAADCEMQNQVHDGANTIKSVSAAPLETRHAADVCLN
jgi:hypothetical protein